MTQHCYTGSYQKRLNVQKLPRHSCIWQVLQSSAYRAAQALAIIAMTSAKIILKVSRILTAHQHN